MTVAVKQGKKRKGGKRKEGEEQGGGGGGGELLLLPGPGELGEKVEMEEPRRGDGGCPMQLMTMVCL